jgi:hypothetical protein
MEATVLERAEPGASQARPADAARLEEQIVLGCARLSAAMARWLADVLAFDELGAWRRYECASCAHWLNWRCGVSLRAARDHLRVARALQHLPEVRAALSGGSLSYSKVRALTRVVTPETQRHWLDVAGAVTASRLEQLVAADAQALRQASAEDETQRSAEQQLHVHWNDDGTLSVRGTLRPEAGAALLSALDGAVVRDQSVPLPARRADALLQLISGSDAAGLAGPAAEIVVHADAEALHPDGSGEPAGRCHIQGGPAISDTTFRRLACDCWRRTVQPVGGCTIDAGRRTRRVGRRLRRALWLRDDGCRFPGCTHRFIQAHHLVHWIDGGATDLDNLVSLCPFHHRRVHEAKLELVLRADGSVDVITPEGVVISQRTRLEPSGGQRAG